MEGTALYKPLNVSMPRSQAICPAKPTAKPTASPRRSARLAGKVNTALPPVAEKPTETVATAPVATVACTFPSFEYKTFAKPTRKSERLQQKTELRVFEQLGGAHVFMEWLKTMGALLEENQSVKPDDPIYERHIRSTASATKLFSFFRNSPHTKTILTNYRYLNATIENKANELVANCNHHLKHLDVGCVCYASLTPEQRAHLIDCFNECINVVSSYKKPVPSPLDAKAKAIAEFLFAMMMAKPAPAPAPTPVVATVPTPAPVEPPAKYTLADYIKSPFTFNDHIPDDMKPLYQAYKDKASKLFNAWIMSYATADYVSFTTHLTQPIMLQYASMAWLITWAASMKSCIDYSHGIKLPAESAYKLLKSCVKAPASLAEFYGTVDYTLNSTQNQPGYSRNHYIDELIDYMNLLPTAMWAQMDPSMRGNIVGRLTPYSNGSEKSRKFINDHI